MKKISITEKQNLKAFTLIELLIVVVIIGILTMMMVFAFSNAKEKSRDATRKTDLSQIKSALKVYYSDQNPNSYIVSVTPITADDRIFGGAKQTYMKIVPTEPVSGRNPYQYQTDAGGQNFILSCDLENDSDGERNLTPPVGFKLNSGYDYWVQND